MRRFRKFWREFTVGFNSGLKHAAWTLDYHTSLTAQNTKARSR